MAGVQPPPHLGDRGGLSSEELACHTQAGSSACFEELVTRFEGRLLHFLAQRSRNVHEAEDLLQETFARAYHKIEKYDSRWRFSTWLFTIAARLACNQRRKPSRQSLEDVHLLPAEGDDPLTIVARQEEKNNLWTLAAELLNENQYTALWLQYAQGMSVKEVSKVMGKTQTNVKVLLFRGRFALARNLRITNSAGRVGYDTKPTGSSRYVSPARMGGE